MNPAGAKPLHCVSFPISVPAVPVSVCRPARTVLQSHRSGRSSERSIHFFRAMWRQAAGHPQRFLRAYGQRLVHKGNRGTFAPCSRMSRSSAPLRSDASSLAAASTRCRPCQLTAAQRMISHPPSFHRRKPVRKVSSSSRTAVGGADEAADTVFALSSGAGKAGVAVLRVSGPRAADVVRLMTARPVHGKATTVTNGGEPLPLPEPRQATLRAVVSPRTGEVLDEGLVLWFPAPRSFTGEDVCELHLHGSRAVVSDVFSELSALSGVRAAEQGEFTRRAFDAGRLDLAQVEGLADLLNADTEAQRRQALRQLGGATSAVYDGWRRRIVKALAHTEAVIDFGEDEEDVTDAVYDAAAGDVMELAEEMRTHLRDGRRGEIVRQGVSVAIVGPPNAGKSSLLNALAGRPAAIVSDVAGTTRDIVEVAMDLAGFSVVLSDTAGVRATDDAIEREGVARAHERVGGADVRICVFDIRHFGPGEDSEALGLVTPDALLVLNKTDLGSSDAVDAAVAFAGDLGHREPHLLSCRANTGLDSFERRLSDMVRQRFQQSADSAGGDGGVLITRARHREHLTDCITFLDHFLEQPAEVRREQPAPSVVLTSRALSLPRTD